MSGYWRVALASALAASSVISCSALLGFPDETATDPNFGLGPDGQVQGDGSSNSQLDGTPNVDGNPSQVDASSDALTTQDSQPPPNDGPNDGPIVLPDGGCNCFGGGCTNGVCEPIAIVTGKTDPNYIDNDNTTVFFASGGTTILALTISNIAAGTTTITSTEPSINDLRARSGYVYFTNSAASMNSVSRCPANGGCGAGRVEYGLSNRKNFGVAVDNTNVYFSVNDATASNGGIWSCTQNGCAGAVRIVTRAYPMFITTNGTNLAWFEGGSGAGVNQSTTSGASVSMGMESGVVDIAFGSAAGAGHYFIKSSSLWHQVGTQASKQIAGGAQVSNAIMVRADASYVYWLNGGPSGSLLRCPVGVDCLVQSSEAKTLAAGLSNPGGLSLSNDSVYFTTRNDLKVWRVRK